MSPYEAKRDQVLCTMGHTVQLMACWRDERPFSDIVTGKTHHAFNLPCLECGYMRDKHALEGACYFNPHAPFWLRRVTGTAFNIDPRSIPSWREPFTATPPPA